MTTDAPTFEQLVTLIQQTHQALLDRATKAVNISLTRTELADRLSHPGV